jgi:guanosine-3',5'-bis(diphosphate) 3'-pyrophosphohydrolase
MKTVLAALHFAAEQHVNQRRKGVAVEPYINHLIEVVALLANAGGVEDPEILTAGALHDVVEDTEVSIDEVAAGYGPAVASMVAEVTDDKALEKQERKRLQIEHMADASAGARLIKLADHTGNVTNLPERWPETRRREYLEWSRKVVAHCRGLAPELEAEYDRRWAHSMALLETGHSAGE